MSTGLDSQLLSVCKSGTLSQAKQLVSDGANPNCRGEMGVTPLMKALESKRSDIVSWLVSKKTVDVDHTNNYKNTALHYASKYCSDADIVAKLATRMEDASVNQINREGKTATFRAVEWNNVSALQGLLAVKSVDWQIGDNNGRSLLDVAREKGNEEIVNLLQLDTDQYETNVSNARMKLEDDPSSFIMKFNITDTKNPKELFNMLPKHLGKLTKIDRGYVKRDNDGKVLQAGITGVGKDNSMPIAEYVLLQKSVSKSECEDDIMPNQYEIHFRMLGDILENTKKTVDFFTKSIWKCFGKEEITMSILLRKTNTYLDKMETDIIILPLQTSSLGFLFKYSELDHPQIVSLLEEADPTWLSLLFNQYDLEDQVDLFGHFKGREIQPTQLHLVAGDQNQTTLLQFLVKGGNIMQRQQDEFISMLMKIDKKETSDKEGGADRVISKLKEGLQSSDQLSALIESVKRKYPMPRMQMCNKIIISFIKNIVGGLGFVFADFGTDWHFTANMWGLYGQAFAPEMRMENENCTEQVDLFKEIEDSCNKLSVESDDAIKCMQNLKEIFSDVENCEVNRFFDPEEWFWMFLISCTHMILPIILCILCGVTLAFSFSEKKKDWWKIMGTLPLVAKIRIFILESRLYRSMSEKDRKEIVIKDVKEEIYEYEDSVTLALLIEASSESSFQFFFQTLYRLPILVLNVYEGTQDHVGSNLFNWRNASILGSFFTMSYSYYTIRNHSKKGALQGIHFGLILSRTVFDTIGRILLVFVWLTLMDVEGNFQPLLANFLYYGVFLILVFFNILFNTSKIMFTAEYILGVLLNSLSSILSYNSYDYSSLLGHNKEKKGQGNANHQQSFIRQCLYTALVTALYISLTCSAVHMIKGKNSAIFIIDTIGLKSEVTPMFFYEILIFSWISHIIACILTICYYNSHPSSVSLNPRYKTEIWIFGTKRNVSCSDQNETAEAFAGPDHVGANCLDGFKISESEILSEVETHVVSVV